jgi:Uma2 family endonuclease
VVDIELSRTWAAGKRYVRLVELEDGHELTLPSPGSRRRPTRSFPGSWEDEGRRRSGSCYGWSMSASMPSSVTVRYEVPASRENWTLSEELMPESQPHDLVLDLLKLLLLAWVKRTGIDAQVARNLAVRWDEAHPSIGVDPDLCLIIPTTPEGDELSSLCLWHDGHRAPVLAIEVVSEKTPRKDYVSAPDRYAASGTGELWIFDPKLAGPKSHGGPFRVQLWRRGSEGDFTRVYAGDGPVRSPAVGGFLVAVDEGRRLRLADDEALTSFWITPEEAERAAKEAERAAKEAERAAKEAERAAKEAERAAKEAALAKVAELEEQLRRLRGA